MRHSTISVTFDVYGHLFPGYLNTVLERLDDDHQRALDEWRRAGELGLEDRGYCETSGHATDGS